MSRDRVLERDVPHLLRLYSVRADGSVVDDSLVTPPLTLDRPERGLPEPERPVQVCGDNCQRLESIEASHAT